MGVLPEWGKRAHGRSLDPILRPYFLSRPSLASSSAAFRSSVALNASAGAAGDLEQGLGFCWCASQYRPHSVHWSSGPKRCPLAPGRIFGLGFAKKGLQPVEVRPMHTARGR